MAEASGVAEVEVDGDGRGKRKHQKRRSVMDDLIIFSLPQGRRGKKSTSGDSRLAAKATETEIEIKPVSTDQVLVQQMEVWGEEKKEEPCRRMIVQAVWAAPGQKMAQGGKRRVFPKLTGAAQGEKLTTKVGTQVTAPQKTTSEGKSGGYLTTAMVWERLVQEGADQKDLAELMEMWDSRPGPWRTETPPTAATKRRLGMLWAISEERRWEVFQDLATKWTAGTAAQYWTMFLATAPIFQRKVSDLSRRIAKNLKEVDRVTVRKWPAAIDPVTARGILKELEGATALCFATTFAFGARFSDVVQLTPDAVQVVEGTGPARFVAVTFSKGKVTKRIGPWTLHLPIESKLAGDLLRQKEMAMKEKWQSLFGDRKERTANLRQVLAPRNLTQRAIRRGALQSVAEVGGVRDVIHLSQHVSEKQAKAYLNWGAQDMQAAHHTAELIDKASLDLYGRQDVSKSGMKPGSREAPYRCTPKTSRGLSISN